VLLPRLKDGAFHPVVVQGWTLSYEMFFYCLIGVLAYRRRTRTTLAGDSLFPRQQTG
jgi:peptidoglycan/LPS O-acetylase OafA/YrhL